MLCIRSVKDFLDDQEKGSCSYKVSGLFDQLIILTSTPLLLTIRNTML